MKPYYDQDGITIYNARCEDVLPTLSDVGLVLTSPPYNLSGDGNKPTGSEVSSLSEGYEDYSDNMPHAQYVSWQHSVLRLCWSALADNGAIYYNHKPIVRGNQAKLPTELVPSEIPLRQVIIWDRGSGFMRVPTFYVPTHEWILMLAKPDFRITSTTVNDVWRVPFETGSDHPAPFPLKLARQAIETTTASVVVDPFSGSGTTLRAALDCGRRAIGIEVSERYCDIAVQRLAQGSLFAALEGER